MANSQQKKTQTNDVVSHVDTPLPEEVIERVFTFLPIKQAGQTSLISTTFKTSWQFNRKLLFGKDFAIRFQQSNIVAIIDRVFRSHKGTEIQSFTLHINPEGVESQIKEWLRISTEKGVQHLEMKFFRPSMTIESEFFDAVQKLRKLKLVNCAIELPRILCGMKFLNKLALWYIELNDVMIEKLVSHCNLLEVMEVCHCTGICHVNIMAKSHRHFKTLKIALCPKLKGIMIDSTTLRYVFYHGNVFRVRFDPELVLTEAFFGLVPSANYFQHDTDQVEVLINRLQFVTILTLSALFLEALTARVRDGLFRGAEYNTLVNIKELQLIMEMGLFCNPYDIFTFLVHCPSLERLFIDLNDYQLECGLYWEKHQQPILMDLDHKFSRLRMVKLMGFKFVSSEIELVKVLLQRAPVLERLIVVTPFNGRPKLSPHDEPKYRELFHSLKASPIANIELYDYRRDFNSPNPTHPKYWF